MSAIPLMSNIMHCRAHRESIERNRQQNIEAGHDSSSQQPMSVNIPPAFNYTHTATVSLDTARAFNFLKTKQTNIMESVHKMFHQH